MFKCINNKQKIFLSAIKIFGEHSGLIVLETGRIRNPLWKKSDGNSTYFFSSLKIIKHLYSVDNDSENYSGYSSSELYCRQCIKPQNLEKITFLNGDSILKIKEISNNIKIDIVLLDSANDPVLIYKEFIAILPYLNPLKSIVIVDDIIYPGKKGNTLIPFIEHKGIKVQKFTVKPSGCAFFELNQSLINLILSNTIKKGDEHSLVLQIKYGGLGDHLFYTHIPRIAKELNLYDKVYISNYSEYRNPDYKKVIWELNSFIDGFVDEDGVIFEREPTSVNENLLDSFMLQLGIDDGKRFHEPEIFYNPNFLKGYENTTIYDPNYVSFVGHSSYSDKSITKYFLDNSVSIDLQFKPGFKNYKIEGHHKFIETITFERYIDIIHSCKTFYCLTSGGATLAASISKQAFVFFGEGQNKMYQHSRLHQYIQILPYKFSIFEKWVRKFKDNVLGILKYIL